MVISMQSTRKKQFLLKIVKFVFCHSKNTTKLYMSGSHNSKVTRHKIIRTWEFRWRFSCKTQLSQRLLEVAFKIFQLFSDLQLKDNENKSWYSTHKKSQKESRLQEVFGPISYSILLSLTATNYPPFLPLSLSTQASFSWVIQTFSLLQSYRYQVFWE